jgi:hypothetical protein
LGIAAKQMTISTATTTAADHPTIMSSTDKKPSAAGRAFHRLPDEIIEQYGFLLLSCGLRRRKC